MSVCTAAFIRVSDHVFSILRLYIALQSETAGPALPTCRHSTIDCPGEVCPWEFQTRDESERLSPSRGPRQDLFKQADADNSGELEFPEIQKVLERPL